MGLLQREIEAAGISTISLSPIPEFTAAVGAPRVAAIAYPTGRTVGKPGDAAGQRAVLAAALEALQSISVPGTVVELPFEWPESPREAASELPETPPIVSAIKRRPWLYRKLLAADFPALVEAEMD